MGRTAALILALVCGMVALLALPARITAWDAGFRSQCQQTAIAGSGFPQDCSSREETVLMWNWMLGNRPLELDFGSEVAYKVHAVDIAADIVGGILIGAAVYYVLSGRKRASKS